MATVSSAGAVAVAFEFDVAVKEDRQIRLTWLIRKGRLTMMQLSQEILVYSRACEHLLSTEGTLNDDESSLVEYYVQELSRKFVPPAPNMQKAAGQQSCTSPSCAP